MSYKRDSDRAQASELMKITNFKGKKVLEIGCGDGYLTKTYAPETGSVVAIDPSAEDIETARKTKPTHLLDNVEFIVTDIRDFSLASRESRFDIALFTWSL